VHPRGEFKKFNIAMGESKKFNIAMDESKEKKLQEKNKTRPYYRGIREKNSPGYILKKPHFFLQNLHSQDYTV
jgi:hypothetical protein